MVREWSGCEVEGVWGIKGGADVWDGQGETFTWSAGLGSVDLGGCGKGNGREGGALGLVILAWEVGVASSVWQSGRG